MEFPELHFEWECRLKSSPGQLWPHISDTNRFDLDAGIPPLQRLGALKGKTGRQLLQLTLFGLEVEWEEEPFEWIYSRRFGVTRRYRKGPIKQLRMKAELEPLPDGGTLLHYQVWSTPANLLGRMLIPFQVGIISKIQFRKVFQEYDRLIQAGQLHVRRTKASSLDVSEIQRLQNGGNEMIRMGSSKEQVQRLMNLLETSDDLFLSKLRPYALAKEWNFSRRETLVLCLHGTRAGLLEFRWDILCPLCRGAKQTTAHLSELGSDVHCDFCQVDFKAGLDQNVEVSFRPAPAIRPIQVYEYCVGGPQLTPHITLQQIIPPGNERTLSLQMEPGEYRTRILGQTESTLLQVHENAPSDAEWISTGDFPHQLSPSCRLKLKNENTQEQVFILEKTAWRNDAATAADVTSLQTFRDLFASEILRLDQKISIGNLVLLFTDLSNSTRLYQQMGDAPAFGYVLDHFDILRRVIDSENGAVVKTIGDAVMAVFTRPTPALEALRKAMKDLSSLPYYEQASVKAGIHMGPCMAVTLNDQLDYFGSMVNIAARLVGLAESREIILSNAIKNDPDVIQWLKEHESEVQVTHTHTMLKGFDQESFQLWKLHFTKAN